MSPFDAARIRSASRTDVGRRRSENQDDFREFEHTSGARLLALADGMGGHRGGRTASRMAIEAMGEVFASRQSPNHDTLREAMEAANTRIYDVASRRSELRGMGTTGVALLFRTDGLACVAHVGDSRAYRLREGSIAPLTADHSFVARLLEQGEITAEEAAVHPRRNEILRSIGSGPSVEVDVAPVETRPGDQFLLCSDGLSGVLTDSEIGSVLLREHPEKAVEILVDLANERGGPDNITVMVAAMPDESMASNSETERTGNDSRRIRWILAATALIGALLALCLIR